MPRRETKTVILQQGAVRFGFAQVVAIGENVAAIECDFESKRIADLCCSADDGRPVLVVWAGDETLHLDETKSVHEFTSISFPEFVGWETFSVENSEGHVIRLCFVRKEQEENHAEDDSD